MASTTLPVDVLRLDAINPRHEAATGGDPEVITALLTKEGDKVIALAEDISLYGPSPIELPLVVEETPGIFTVVEGNRRLASVRLLADPELATSASDKAKLRAFAKNPFAQVKTLDCFVAVDRAEAKHWQERRHIGEGGGRGVVDWDTEAKARFFGTTTGQTAIAVAIADSLTKAYPTNRTLLHDLAVLRTKRFTNLGRLFGNPTARNAFGLTSKYEIRPEAQSPALEDAFAKVIAELAHRSSVAAIDNKDQRREFIEKFAPKVPAPTPVPAPLPTQTPAPAPPLALAPKPNPPPPPAKLFEGVTINKLGSRIPVILREIHDLPLNTYPNAAAVLIRVLVDLAVTQVYDLNGWPILPNMKLRHLIEGCVDKLDPSKKSDRYKAVRVGLKTPNSIFEISTLHGWVHNPSFHPAPADLRAIAANYSDFLSDLDTLVP